MTGPARLRVRVTPRAARDEIAGVRDDGVLAVRLTAPPVDGKANAALCAFLAGRLGVPKSRVRVARGASARVKTVEVDGLDDAAVRATLGI